MKVDINLIAVLLGLFFIALIAGSVSSLPKDPFLGISPEDEKYYKSASDTLKCKDGSKKFTKAQLNDDFCDCPDGTDEPGTSACPRGKFYCRNAGHSPLLIYSSRVNDGICDCCDGTDEYDGNVKCPNTCWEAGKVARDKLKKKISTYQEGVAIRSKDVQQAKLDMTKDEEELAKLKNEEKILKGLVEQLKEHKERIDKAEEKERLQKEKEEKEKKEAEEKASGEETAEEAKQDTVEAKEKVESEYNPVESTDDDKIGLLDDALSNEDVPKEYVDDDHPAEAEHHGTPENVGSLVGDSEQHEMGDRESSSVVTEIGHDASSKMSPDQTTDVGIDVPENTEGLSREDLGRLVASRWTGENAEKQTEEGDAKDSEHQGQEEIPKDTHDEEYDNYASDTDDESGKYYEDNVEDDIDEAYEEDHDDTGSSYKSDADDDIDLSDTNVPSNPSWLEKIQQTVKNILQAVNLFQTPVDISEAARVRKEYDESSTKLSKIQKKISSLTQKLKHDFGPEKEFYSFYNRCFESKQNKYVYKVCPYKQASQVEAHSTTRLGEWDKFEDSYRSMVFSNGDKCWNGPDRSLKVKLRCGLTNEITDVDEPSRCEYVALLSTPALCLEEKLKELQHKLDLMNMEQPQRHDEL